MRRTGTSPDVIQRGPRVSYSTTRYWMASFAVLIPPAGFMPTCRPVCLLEIADRLEHHEGHGERGCRRHLAGRGLDEVRAGGHRQHARPANVVVRLELARLEDDLEVRLAARLLDLDDLVEHGPVVAGEERATIDDHVDLVGAGFDRLAGLGILISRKVWPDGKPVATLATFTVEPRSASFASATSAG